MDKQIGLRGSALFHGFGAAGIAMLCGSLLSPVVTAMGETEGWHHGLPFAYDKGLLDSVGFDRSVLADKGVNLHMSSLSTYQNIVDGGVEDTDQYSHSYDFQAYFDTTKMNLWDGGYAVIRAEGKTDDAGVNFDTGAIIPVNFDAMVPEPGGKGFELTEWWYSQSFLDGKVEMLGGMYDIARFFDIVPSSGPYHYRFQNAHMFFNSVLLPYAPYNLLGGAVIVKPTDWLTITTGVADPHSSAVDVDWFEEGDVNILHEWRAMAKPFGKPGMYAVGLAYNDVETATIAQDPTLPGEESEDDNWAYYLNFNQWVYQNPDNPHRSVSVFGRVGITNGDTAIIENHYSLGVSFDGLLSSRPKDVFGIVGWHNDFSGDLSNTLDDASNGFEAYYRFQVTPWLQFGPDIQYLIDPGIHKGTDDTTVLGARALILL